MLVVPIPEREFNLYALSLPEGPNSDPYVVVSGWKSDNARSIGGVLLDHETADFSIRVFRRRTDHCFTVTSSKAGVKSHDAATTMSWGLRCMEIEYIRYSRIANEKASIGSGR